MQRQGDNLDVKVQSAEQELAALSHTLEGMMGKGVAFAWGGVGVVVRPPLWAAALLWSLSPVIYKKLFWRSQPYQLFC